MKLETKYAEQIAQAASQQLKQRIEAYTGESLRFQYFSPEKISNFLRQLEIPETLDLGLVTDESRFGRDKFTELAKNAFNYETPSKTLFIVYPRGIIIGDRLSGDREELSPVISSKNIGRKIKAEAIRFNRRISPAVRLLSHGTHGTHIFSSEKEYIKSLRNPVTYKIMSDVFNRWSENPDKDSDQQNLPESGARYFGVFRLDMLIPTIYGPGEKRSGWLEKWAREVKIPLFVLPNANPKELEELIALEKVALRI